MAEPWLVYLLVFAAAAICAQLAQLAIRRMIRRDKRTAQRFAELDDGVAPTPQVDVLRRKPAGGPAAAWLARLHLLIAQSGTTTTPGRLARYAAIACALLFVALPLPLPWPARLVIATATALLLVYAWLRFKRARRIARFAEQLPDIIDVIVRSLRAGHPLPISLALVAREMPAPAGPEFGLVVDEITYGRSVGEAMALLERRIGYRELRFLVSSIIIAQQTGGNMAEILSRLSRMLRDRFRLTRKVRALSAEGRFSGYALSALPILLFGLIQLISSSFYAEFWESSVRNPILLIAGTLLLLGNLVIYKMVNFKV
jgi:tight adherence protein B